MNLRKYLIFLLLIPYQSYSAIEITTIDAFKILNLGEHHLMVIKFSESQDSQNTFMFQMRRPFCLCEEPSFLFNSPSIADFDRPKEDSRIQGNLIMDFSKKHDIELEVYLANPESTQNILALRGNFPSLRTAKVIEIETVYGKDKFVIKGIESAMKQATKICETFVSYIDKPNKVNELKL